MSKKSILTRFSMILILSFISLGVIGGCENGDGELGGNENFAMVTFINRCEFPIWLGGVTGKTSTGSLTCPAAEEPESFVKLDEFNPQMPPSMQTVDVKVGSTSCAWWPRTKCSKDETGKFFCETGDCGGETECNPAGSQANNIWQGPGCVGSGCGVFTATKIELTTGTVGGGQFFSNYDVSVEQGAFNVPVLIAPADPEGSNCTAGRDNDKITDGNAGCYEECDGISTLDIASWCPPPPTDDVRKEDVNGEGTGLQAIFKGDLVACFDECSEFILAKGPIGGNNPNIDSQKICCKGKFSTPDTCPKPDTWPDLGEEQNEIWRDYTKTFLKFCPRQFAWAFDDSLGLPVDFSCTSKNEEPVHLDITFCGFIPGQCADDL